MKDESRQAGAPRRGLARPRRMRQCGRAALLWALGLYVVGQVAFTFSIGPWHPTEFDTVWQQKWRRLRQLTARAPDRPLLLMLGSSRTELAFDAGHLNGMPAPDGQPFVAYNFGVPGVGPLRQGLCLSELLEAGIRPRLLLIEFSPPLLNEPRRNFTSEEDWVWARSMSVPQLARLWPYLARPDRKRRDWVKARLAPWYVFRPQLQTLLRDTLYPEEARPLAPSHNAWGLQLPNDRGTDDWTFPAWRAHRMYHKSLGLLHVADGPSQAMRDLLERCRREEIPVVLVLMPESTTFRTWYRPEGLADARRLLGELSATYAVSVIDANNWLADTQFTDGHHATPDGARAFTTHLRAEVQRILVRAGEADKRGQTR